MQEEKFSPEESFRLIQSMISKTKQDMSDNSIYFQSRDYIFRIGNLTFLESGKNKEADRKSFEEKQRIYSTSNYKLTNEQIEYYIWNVTSLASRQADMANKAATVWKINYQ